MDFGDLKALISVHEQGSLQRASAVTGVSRTTLRRRLRHLEAVAGRPLLRSSPGGIELTPAGQTLVKEGAQLLASRDRLLERVRATDSKDELRVLVQLGLPPRAVASATALFAKVLPEVQLSLDFDANPGSRLDEGFDAVLHWGESPVMSSGYTRTLMRVSFGVLGSSAYLDRCGRPQTPADLAQHCLLALEGAAPRWPLKRGGFVEVRPGLRCSDLYMLGLLAGKGLGLALMPLRGPVLEAGTDLGGLMDGALVDPSISALEPVLADHIALERSFRMDMPEPSDSDGAAALLIEVAKNFGQALDPI